MDYPTVEKIIEDLRIHSHYGPTTWKMKQEVFQYESYAKWALDEIRLYLMTHMNSRKPIYQIMEEFRYLMDSYACQSKSPETNFMFSVAYDVVTEVLDEMLIVDQAFGEDETW